VLNRALENVVAAYGNAGLFEEAWLRKAAAKLIFEAYDQGIRDEDVLVHQVLKTLRRGRPVSGTNFSIGSNTKGND
jgi:hypothetical protein